MNGGKAKTLRGHARMKTTGKVERKYRIKNASKPVEGTTLDPTIPPPVVTPPGTIALIDDCTRRVYQRLKKCA